VLLANAWRISPRGGRTHAVCRSPQSSANPVHCQFLRWYGRSSGRSLIFASGHRYVFGPVWSQRMARLTVETWPTRCALFPLCRPARWCQAAFADAIRTTGLCARKPPSGPTCRSPKLLACLDTIVQGYTGPCHPDAFCDVRLPCQRSRKLRLEAIDWSVISSGRPNETARTQPYPLRPTMAKRSSGISKRSAHV